MNRRPPPGRCPDGTQHDWVVADMFGQRDLTAYYQIECADCGAKQDGEAHEIPNARFK
jgi:hypothetical protein